MVMRWLRIIHMRSPHGTLSVRLIILEVLCENFEPIWSIHISKPQFVIK